MSERIATTFRVQGGELIRARSRVLGGDMGSVLILEFEASDWKNGAAEITAFLDNAELAAELADAINVVVSAHKKVEAAA